MTCQFLGIHSTTIEVNPFLADLIEAKLSAYDIDRLIHDRAALACTVDAMEPDLGKYYSDAPLTLCETGKDNRWVFDREILYRVTQFRAAIDTIPDQTSARLFRVLLGALLVPLSNVVISGKGRRYRRKWQRIIRSAGMVDAEFDRLFQLALFDICRFPSRARSGYRLIRGDSRDVLRRFDETIDVAIFSPPYPNSFDYTDIYNLELWVLGYLTSRLENTALRRATLRSHVQIKRRFAPAPASSPTLCATIKRLHERRAAMWDQDLPAMVGSYFADLVQILRALGNRLSEAGFIAMVIGDSRYADVIVKVPRIVEEQAAEAGLRIERRDEIRSMRSSAQQGGAHELGEALLRLRRA